MTGYGRGESEGNGLKCLVEISSVNHRFCEIMVKLSKNLLALELKIREYIRGKINRGKINVLVSFRYTERYVPEIILNRSLAKQYYEMLNRLKDELKLLDEIRLDLLLRFPDLFEIMEITEDVEKIWPMVKEALDSAIKNMMEMKEREGAYLAEDLKKRLKVLFSLSEEVERRCLELRESIPQKLRERVREILCDVPVNEDRLLTEIALFQEKRDATEEIVRFKSHLNQFWEMLMGGSPVGRKMDFLVQEMLREVNTLSSKAGEAEISKLVVEMKAELERIREQVQNIE
ncbi:MAG: YicC family protein [Synergistetes bacterium]|nr:YicC family protein [Synergistota bacterium]MCX8127511.1 YicC family protein [Synergistota bacterium]MDW8191573.1 YicC/YloC family endoribonuclease [Synergistota bacterium]